MNTIIKFTQKSNLEEHHSLCVDALSPHSIYAADAILTMIRMEQEYTRCIEVVIDNKLVGVCIVKDRNDVREKIEGKGLEIFLLAIKDDYTNKGLGTKVLDFLKSEYKNEYDYLWCIQDKNLKSKPFWNKHYQQYNESFLHFYHFLKI